jgi:hypothetical protein
MIDGSPEIQPDILPPDDESIVNGWTARRAAPFPGYYPQLSKACTSATSHGVYVWDSVRYQNPWYLYSSPSLALRSLLPQILKAYADEIAATLQKIKEHE